MLRSVAAWWLANQQLPAWSKALLRKLIILYQARIFTQFIVQEDIKKFESTHHHHFPEPDLYS